MFDWKAHKCSILPAQVYYCFPDNGERKENIIHNLNPVSKRRWQSRSEFDKRNLNQETNELKEPLLKIKKKTSALLKYVDQRVVKQLENVLQHLGNIFSETNFAERIIHPLHTKITKLVSIVTRHLLSTRHALQH